MSARGLLAGALLLAPGLAPAELRGESADEILAMVRASLPREPVLLQAELKVRQPGGAALRTLLAEMRLDWGAEPANATYLLSDRFGEPMEEMRIAWDPEGRADYRLRRGSPLEPVEDPDPSRRIDGLDISWSDLSLSFLWWTGGEVRAPERVRNRTCHVLDLPAPAGETHYGRARLWIDQEALAVLEAEVFDRDERRIRRLVVKSIQKVDEVWMLRDLDVFSYPSRHRTSLRVLGMETEGPRSAGDPEPEAHPEAEEAAEAAP